MAVSNATVIPIIWAARLIRALNDQYIWAGRTNRTWQSQLQAGGDRVRLNAVADVITVGDYTTATTIAYGALDAAAAQDLVLDTAKYWAVKADDIQTMQSNPTLLDAALAQAAEKMAKEVDDDVRAIVKAAATGIGALALDYDKTGGLTINDFGLATMIRHMDVASVPEAERWVIIGPYTKEAFTVAALEAGNAWTPAGQDVARNGFVGSYAGIRIFVDNDGDSTFNDGADTATETMYGGIDYATAFIDQVNEVESLRLESTFATGVRGLYNYGAKVIEAASLFKRTVNLTNVP